MTNPPENFYKLCDAMSLNEYQRQVLQTNYSKYNMHGLVKRGGVLYAPYVQHGLWCKFKKILIGRRADLIGENKIIVQNRCGIKFNANGCHCIPVGPYRYYADNNGNAISRKMFKCLTTKSEH